MTVWNGILFKCLEVFGFGPSLTRWVQTFYNNITSCIIHNCTLSASFEINRGVRQGDPLSPYLFIIAVELLAVSIRSCSEINGIKIDSKEFKMVQYADDLTAFVSDIRSAQCLFKGARSRYFRQFCLILSIMSSKRQIGRARVFQLQIQGHITTENDFPAV